MITIEIKNEIRKLLDVVPEDTFRDLLGYLKKAREQTNDKGEFSRRLRQILQEDKELLEKLAQRLTLKKYLLFTTCLLTDLVEARE